MARRKKKSESRTLVALVLDKSGSMNTRRRETIDAMNEYIETLRQGGEGEIIASMIQFDSNAYGNYDRSSHRFEKTFTMEPIQSVKNLTERDYVPRGMTPLYDAIGHMVRTIESAERKDDKVVVTIMTDGLENASHEFSRSGIKELRDQKEADGWEFIYLGAGEQAWVGGQDLGFRQSQTVSYGTLDAADHKDAVYLAASANVTTTKSLRGSRASESFLTASPEKTRLERKAKREKSIK